MQWAVIAALIALDGILAWSTGTTIVHWHDHLAGAALWLLPVPVMVVVFRLTGRARDGIFASQMLAQAVASMKALVLLSYFAAMSPLPLADAQLAAIDRGLGFDWLAYYRWAMAPGIAHDALSLGYGGLFGEAVIVLGAIYLFARDDARRFVKAMIVSLLITIAVFALFPAAGPYVTAGVEVPPWGDFTEHFLAAHAHALDRIDDIRGLISFPSFHACAAVLLAYFSRNVRPLFVLVLPFNAAMIAATPAFGGHYLADVVAGVAVALVTIAATAPRRRAAFSLPAIAQAYR